MESVLLIFFIFFFLCVYWLSTVSLFVLCLGCPMLTLTPDHFYGSLAFLYLYNTESEISSCKHLIVGAQHHFQQYIRYIMATNFSGGKSRSIRRTTDYGEATGKLFHFRLRVECTCFVIYKVGREPSPYR